MDVDSVFAHKHAKRERNQYPALRLLHINPYAFQTYSLAEFFRTHRRGSLRMNNSTVIYCPVSVNKNEPLQIKREKIC